MPLYTVVAVTFDRYSAQVVRREEEAKLKRNDLQILEISNTRFQIVAPFEFPRKKLNNKECDFNRCGCHTVTGTLIVNDKDDNND